MRCWENSTSNRHQPPARYTVRPIYPHRPGLVIKVFHGPPCFLMYRFYARLIWWLTFRRSIDVMVYESADGRLRQATRDCSKALVICNSELQSFRHLQQCKRPLFSFSCSKALGRILHNVARASGCQYEMIFHQHVMKHCKTFWTCCTIVFK